MDASSLGTGERKTSYVLMNENIIVSFKTEQITQWVNVLGSSPSSSTATSLSV